MWLSVVMVTVIAAWLTLTNDCVPQRQTQTAGSAWELNSAFPVFHLPIHLQNNNFVQLQVRLHQTCFIEGKAS